MVHDEFGGILFTSGVLGESVGATLSKRPSFFGSYAGMHHAMEEAHKCEQYRRLNAGSTTRETLPPKIKLPKEGKVAAEGDNVENEDAGGGVDRLPRVHDHTDVFNHSVRWFRQEISREELE